MSELKKVTIHLHATFTPTAEMDGGKVMVVMGEPEVIECDCKPAPGSAVAHRGGSTHESPGRTNLRQTTT